MKPIEDFVPLLAIKRYADNTISVYKSCLEQFFNTCNKSAQDIRQKDIQQYIYHKVNIEKLSFSTQKQIVSALKLFYKEIHKKELYIDYLYPDRREQKLPVVLSKAEVTGIINTPTNVKHHAILTGLYSAGLRLSEIVNLKINDIDSAGMVINVRDGKGRKDRTVMLAQKFLDLLRIYYKIYRPGYWLFEGQKGYKYSTRSVQNIFKAALLQSGIEKKSHRTYFTT